MVVRHDGDGVLAVPQPAHAWLCGQFARGWGNGRFGTVDPLDDVALAAEQHDVGWTRWDLAPQRDPATGLPVSFIDCGVLTSTALWRTGPPRLLAQSRYAALLATRHGRRLFERLDLAERPAVEAEAIRALLDESRSREQELCDDLAADPILGAAVTEATLARNSDLVWAWDTLSLALLLDWMPLTLRAVPAAAGERLDVAVQTVDTATADGTAATVALSPWPFTAPRALTVRTEGRRVRGHPADLPALHAALARAPGETVRFTLVPGAD